MLLVFALLHHITALHCLHTESITLEAYSSDGIATGSRFPPLMRMSWSNKESPVCICAVSRWKPSSARMKLIHAIFKCNHLLPEDVKCVTVTLFFYCALNMQILSLRVLNTWKLSWAKWQLAKLLECNTPGSDWIKKGFSYNSVKEFFTSPLSSASMCTVCSAVGAWNWSYILRMEEHFSRLRDTRCQLCLAYKPRMLIGLLKGCPSLAKQETVHI